MATEQLIAQQAAAIRRLLTVLRSYYRQRFGIKCVNASVTPGTILVREQHSELYVRIAPLSDERGCSMKLVIARISFDDERSGHGTALLKCLALAAEEVGYKAVEVEAVNKASEAFAKRLCMRVAGPMSYIADITTLIAGIDAVTQREA